MTLEIFIETVLLRVNGGVLVSDSNVQRTDIRVLIPAAVNYALTAGRNTSLSQEGNRDLPSMFYGTFSALTINYTGSVAYVTLPKGYVPLYGNEGVRSVFDNCGNYYSPLMDADRRVIKDYQKKLEGQGFYYPIGLNKIEVYPSNPLVVSLNGEYIVRVEDLADTDELPLVADTAVMALDLCVQWFTDQRSRPADLINNMVDDANNLNK